MQLQIRIYGIVQGVGFRPTVSRHAMKHNIKGTVCNKGPYVEVLAEGTKEELENFVEAIKNKSPRRSVILKVDCKERTDLEPFTEFSIIESEKTKGSIFVSPDIAICEDCKKEMYDPNNKRYLHPFINCTCCGPRLTILDSMPYDRERTSMKEFPMCDNCLKEYTDIENRRYDAQPVCCNDCGPEVYMIKGDEKGRDAITKTRQIIKDGGIVAIKGIGGFHLCCDATNEKAVSTLRKRKNRPEKPFAVMMRDFETVKQECFVEKGQEEILNGHQKPIILLKRKESGKISKSVAPGNPKIGVMLPYAPVQLLLFDYDDGIEMPDMFVMTSANVSGAPICRTDEDALNELENLCEDMLSHNRKIRLRSDDTVMDFYRGKPYMVRRSRGYAPLPVMMKEEWEGQVLAVGGELKNSFCIGRDDLFYLSPYVGDMEDVRTVVAFRESVKRMENLLETDPEAICCDMHPRYQTTEEAQNMGFEEVEKIQHHYAHIVSCMAENDYSEPVIGVSFDGTGYGTDGTIWGGEILKADYNSFTRLGSIEPFTQVGGDVSSREGWRIAVSLIYDIYGEEEALKIIDKLKLATKEEAKTLFVMVDKKINAVTSTSVGRLFDGVSSILGIGNKSSYEGALAIKLQFAAENNKVIAAQRNNKVIAAQQNNKVIAATQNNKITLAEQNNKVIDQNKNDININSEYDLMENLIEQNGNFYHLKTKKLVKRMVEGRLNGEDINSLAYEFHETLAEMIAKICEILTKKEKINTVALSGGVFQNTLLLELCHEKLEKKNITVLLHSMVPPNDGGIALGQAVVMMNKLNKMKREDERECVLDFQQK